MKKTTHSLLAVTILIAAAMIFMACVQERVSEPDSFLGEKSSGQEDDDQDRDYDCSIKVHDSELEDLSSLAQITAGQAEEAALGA